MARTVPPVPYKTPMVDQAGKLSGPWTQWFRELYERIGGKIALTNSELQDQQSGDVADLEDDISTLQATTTSHTSSISSLTSSVSTLQSTATSLQNQIYDLLKAPVPE